MSGERVEAIKRRARVFLELAKELLTRNILDIASFNIHQACQLRLKATLLRLRGTIPRIHGIRELIGLLTNTLDELEFKHVAEKIRKFVREHRETLIDIESAYTESRYSIAVPTANSVKNMFEIAEKLFKLLDEVEENVLG